MHLRGALLTPELVVLAMALVTLPSWSPDGIRFVGGEGWVVEPSDDPDAWPHYPDLTSAANGGVLLERLPQGWAVFDGLIVNGKRSIRIKLLGSVSIAYEGPTLAAAAAQALIALEEM